jgi:hypothetical protein
VDSIKQRPFVEIIKCTKSNKMSADGQNRGGMLY